jgi:hypothetical protein
MDISTFPPETSLDLLETCVENLRNSLPPTWTVRTTGGSNEPSSRRPDALLEVVAPNGDRATLVVETKRLVERRDVLPILEQVRAYSSPMTSHALIVSRYLSPSVRDAIAEARASYVDATGNVRLDLEQPSIFVAERGLDRDPWRIRQGRPRGTLKGSPASRIIRTLVDADRVWSVRDLITESGVSTGATYRVLDFLQQEGLVNRNELGRFEVPNWRALLEAWSRDYGFIRSNKSVSYVDPRGLAHFKQNIAGTRDFRWAVTGSVAAEEWAPYAPARLAMVYVESVTRAVAVWGLTRADSGANVILAEPESDVAFRRSSKLGSTPLPLAAPSQVAVDLLTGPGRNPSEGMELLDWMERNESRWRD